MPNTKVSEVHLQTHLVAHCRIHVGMWVSRIFSEWHLPKKYKFPTSGKFTREMWHFLITFMFFDNLFRKGLWCWISVFASEGCSYWLGFFVATLREYLLSSLQAIHIILHCVDNSCMISRFGHPKSIKFVFEFGPFVSFIWISLTDTIETTDTCEGISFLSGLYWPKVY